MTFEGKGPVFAYYIPRAQHSGYSMDQMKDLNGTPQRKTEKGSPSASPANDYLLWDVSHYNERRLGCKVTRKDSIIGLYTSL